VVSARSLVSLVCGILVVSVDSVVAVDSVDSVVPVLDCSLSDFCCYSGCCSFL